MNCPVCGAQSWKVIYMGVPLRLCVDDECSCAFGPWSWLMNLLPFNGVFMAYGGGYLSALWHWLTMVDE